jgi:hypothetical protein
MWEGRGDIGVCGWMMMNWTTLPESSVGKGLSTSRERSKQWARGIVSREAEEEEMVKGREEADRRSVEGMVAGGVNQKNR